MPVAGYVSRGGRADCPRDMPGHGVDRLDLAPVALPCPGIEQAARAGQRGRPVGTEQRHVPGPGGEVTGHDRAGAAGHGLASRHPGPAAAVQDPHLLVAEVAQCPPGPGRRQGVVLVVEDHGAPVPYAGPPHGGLVGPGPGQRMAATWPGRGGQIVVHVDEGSAGQVAGQVVADSRRAADPPAHVQQRRPVLSGQRLGQSCDVDQRTHSASLPPAPAPPAPAPPASAPPGPTRPGPTHRPWCQAGYPARKLSSGTSWSAGVSEPCMPMSADSSGSAWLATRAHASAGAATTSPIRSRKSGSVGPNQPSATASSLDATHALPPSTSRQAASTSSVAPGSVYTWRARGSPPSSATPSRSPGTASTSIFSAKGTSTMP